MTEIESHEGAIREVVKEAQKPRFIHGEWPLSGVCGTMLNPSATILFPNQVTF